MSTKTSTALRAVSCISSILGLSCNVYILLVLVSNRQMRTANNLLLFHLALVDILSCLQLFAAVIPTFSTTETLDYIPSSNAVSDGKSDVVIEHYNQSITCLVHGFIFTALLPIVLWTLCGLNCDRYAAIASPLHYSRFIRSRRIVIFIIFVWILGLTLAIPPLFSINRYALQPDNSICTLDFSNSILDITALSGHRRWYPFFYTSLSLLLPAFLIVLCNVRILIIASHHRHRIVSAIYEVTWRAQATITHQRNPFYLSKYKGRNAVATIFQVLGSLVFLYGLQGGVMLWETITGRCHGLTGLNGVAFGLVSCSPTLNGFVYGVKSRVLRTTFKNFLRKHLTTSEVRHEIKRRGSVINGGHNLRSSLILKLHGATTNNSSFSSKHSSANGYQQNHSLPDTPIVTNEQVSGDSDLTTINGKANGIKLLRRQRSLEI